MSNKDQKVVFGEEGLRQMVAISTCFGTTTVDPGVVDALLEAHQEWHAANPEKLPCHPRTTPVTVPYWMTSGASLHKE